MYCYLGISSLVAMTPNGQTLCVCVCLMHACLFACVCCKYQRDCLTTLTLAVQRCQCCLVWPITFDGWSLSTENCQPSPSLPPLACFRGEWTCETKVICLRDIRQLCFCLGWFRSCHHLEQYKSQSTVLYTASQTYLLLLCHPFKFI